MTSTTPAATPDTNTDYRPLTYRVEMPTGLTIAPLTVACDPGELAGEIRDHLDPNGAFDFEVEIAEDGQTARVVNDDGSESGYDTLTITEVTAPTKPTREIKARYLTTGMVVLLHGEPHTVTAVERDDDTVLVTVDGITGEAPYDPEEAVTVVGDRVEPDYWTTLAADLRRVAERLATLAGTEAKPVSVSLHILGSHHQGDSEAMIPLVDKLADRFTATATHTRDGYYEANARIGLVRVSPYTMVPRPQQFELERALARIAELEAQQATGGAA